MSDSGQSDHDKILQQWKQMFQLKIPADNCEETSCSLATESQNDNTIVVGSTAHFCDSELELVKESNKGHHRVDVGK